MMSSGSKAPKCFIQYHRLLFVWVLFSVFPCYAEISSTTNVVSSVAAAQKTEAATDSSLGAESQPVAETVTPFYEKSGAPQSATKPAPKIGSGGHLLSVTLGLAAIIGLIFVLSLFVKRFGSGTFATNTQLKIISSMPLGTRERIVLIDAGGQQLLLGITPTNINTLHVFADPIVVDNKPDVQSDFSRKLMAILQQKTPNPSSNNKNNSASQE